MSDEERTILLNELETFFTLTRDFVGGVESLLDVLTAEQALRCDYNTLPLKEQCRKLKEAMK